MRSPEKRKPHRPSKVALLKFLVLGRPALSGLRVSRGRTYRVRQAQRKANTLQLQHAFLFHPLPFMRRSTIELHPIFSEAPHVRSSMPHPKTDLKQKSYRIAANNPMARVYKTFFIEIKIGVKEPSFSENK